MRARRTIWAALAALAVAACGPAPVADATAPTVVLVVLDNVRSDHLSLCGYERPTSPVLESLVASGEWSATCAAYVPGAWTLPVHASLFTGLEVPDHGAHSASSVPALFSWGGNAHPLGPEPTTLAEVFAARGYRTVAVSANPVVSEATGLTRGFEIARSAPSFGAWYGKGLLDVLDETLREARRDDRPLFLFVNAADAHTPWTGIPAGLGWVGPRRGLSFHVAAGTPWVRYVNGELDGPDATAFLAHYRDVYDFGVLRADATLGGVLELVDRRRRDGRPLRVVVTSDHGEHLGEHGVVGHCCTAYEELTRVPLISNVDLGSRAFPEPLSALVAYHLARDGRLPEPLPPVRMMAGPSMTWQALSPRLGHEIWGALWRGERKLTWRSGRTAAFDLGEDPSETRPEDSIDEGDAAELLAFAKRIEQSLGRAPAENRELYEKLRALGYVN